MKNTNTQFLIYSVTGIGVPKYKPSYEELSAILYGSYMNFWVTLNFRISLFFVAGSK